jgi:protein-tyrosine phosphatase
VRPAVGRRVYVHCTAGLGRSPLVLVGYFTLVKEMPEAHAFALVKARRPGAVPSPEALASCRADLCG